VLDDGGEVDLDYERFLDEVTLKKDNNITTGKIYQQVIEREVCVYPNLIDNSDEAEETPSEKLFLIVISKTGSNVSRRFQCLNPLTTAQMSASSSLVYSYSIMRLQKGRSVILSQLHLLKPVNSFNSE
jgi:hypothetical protein